MTSDGVPTPDLSADPVPAVQAWAAQAAGAGDPVRMRIIEGLARRASAQQGLAREALVLRLAELMAQTPYAPQSSPPADAGEIGAQASGLASLSALVDRLGRMVPPTSAPPSRPASASPGDAGAARQSSTPAARAQAPSALARGQAPSALARGQAPSALARAVPPQPLKAVAAYQGTWSRLRAEQRLRQALAQVPQQAGPLNSSHVVHRALKLLYELSPAYLASFMAHIDALLALEQASGAGDLALRAAAPAEASRRPAARPRKG